MTIPLVILAIFAAASGLWLVLGSGFSGIIHYPYSPDLGAAETETGSHILSAILLSPLTYVSLTVAIGGILFARSRYRAGLPTSEVETPVRGWRGLLYNRYYVTQAIYEPLGDTVAYGVARLSAWFDRRGIDGAVNGIARQTDDAGARVRRWQDGRLSTYMASIAVGLTVILLLLHEVVLRFRW
jgi:NADH-quinone oxidoreductase subunit L